MRSACLSALLTTAFAYDPGSESIDDNNLAIGTMSAVKALPGPDRPRHVGAGPPREAKLQALGSDLPDTLGGRLARGLP